MLAGARAAGADAVLVLHRGERILERHFQGGDRPLRAMSISKSVTSLGVGALLDDGLIKSVHQPIQDFLPE